MARRRKDDDRDAQQAAGCHTFVVTFVMPVLSIIVAAGALYHGAMLTIDCERLAPKRTEEEIVESGTITFPTQRVVEEGRVDVRITRKIIGLFPVSRVHLADVVDVDSTSSTTDVTDSRGHRTSSYSSGRLDLTTRGGRKWSSPEISRSVGHSAGKMEATIQQVLDSNELRRVKVWSMGWLANIIGVPFTLVALMFVWRWIARLLGRPLPSTPT